MMIEVTDEELHFITSALFCLQSAKASYARKIEERKLRTFDGRVPSRKDADKANGEADKVSRVHLRFMGIWREKQNKLTMDGGR